MIRTALIGLVLIILSGVVYFVLVREKGVAPVAVRVVPVQQGTFAASVLGRGKLIARKKQQLVSLVAGVVYDRGVSIGQFLPKRSTIAMVRLPEPEMRKKRQDLEYALLDLEILEEQIQQSTDLLRAKAISEREFKELKIRKYKQEKLVQNLRDDLNDKPIQTSFAGLLVEKLFHDGDRVGAGTVLATIIDTASYAVEALIGQHQIAGITVGQRVHYTSLTLLGERHGRVLEIARAATSKQSGQFGAGETEPEFTVLASIGTSRFDNPFLGAQLEARFVTQEKDVALFVPVDALLYRDDTTMVFVSSQGIARKRIVTTGLSNDRFVEIVNGLGLGDTVVTVGNLDIEDGASVVTSVGMPAYDQTKPSSKPNLFAF